MSRRILLLGIAVLAVAQEPIYRSGTQLVQVDVVVRNDKGAVKDLTADDFTVQDKGKTQKISVFAPYERGNAPGKAAPLPKGVVYNRQNSEGQTTQGATLILFDRANMLRSGGDKNDPSNVDVGGAQANARRQLLLTLASLSPSDRVGLYSLYQDLTVVQDFTEDAGPLVEAAKRVNAAPGGQASGLEATLRQALTPGQDLENVARVDVTATAFRSIARHMDGVQGPKSVIWIASSFPLTYGGSSERQENDEAEVQNIANILGDANIALYSIDPRGAGSSFTNQTGSNNTEQEGRAMPTKGRGGLAQLDTLVQGSSSLSGTQAMEIIANQTGGKAFINVNDISIPIREAMSDSEQAYTLGYYVDDKSMDGKKHDIGVKLSKKAQSGAKLFYRKSYIANPHPAVPQMNALVTDKLDANRIGVMAVAFPDPKRPGVDAVQVRVDLKDLQFEKLADKWNAAFDLGLAIETGGQPEVAVSPNKLSLSDEQLKKALGAGVIIDNTVPAPAKAATLHVIVQDKATGAAGAVRVALPGK